MANKIQSFCVSLETPFQIYPILYKNQAKSQEDSTTAAFISVLL